MGSRIPGCISWNFLPGKVCYAGRSALLLQGICKQLKEIIKLDKPRIYVDLNEMVTEDTVLLSKEDTKMDSEGNIITFYDKMPILIYSDDVSDFGETDNLLAEGIAIKYDLKQYPGWEHVKWCVRIDWNSLIHESDFHFLRLMSVEIKKHPHDLHFLHGCLKNFKEQGMNKDRMYKNLERLRQESDSETENVLVELMDFVSGWCHSSLSIFE